MEKRILLNHLYVQTTAPDDKAAPASQAKVGTVLANMAYFGYAPSLDLLEWLKSLSSPALAAFWTNILPAFREITGDDRNMGDFVVYKNFPKEVLEMSRAQYWVSQILMYLGAPNEFFTQPEEKREPLQENLRLKVLRPAPGNAIELIFNDLLVCKSRWTDTQQEESEYLLACADDLPLNLGHFGFKENGVRLIAKALDADAANIRRVTIHDATDVLRLAAALSDTEISLRGQVSFKNFKRSERRMLLSILEDCKNLDEDFAMRPALWKRTLQRLHPGDYDFKRVQKAYDALYQGVHQTYNSQVEAGIFRKDPSVIELVAARPGDFARRLHALYGVFGEEVIDAFVAVMDQLDTQQIMKLAGYINSINNRKTLIYAPNSQWRKSQVEPNTKVPFSATAIAKLHDRVQSIVSERLSKRFPEGIDLDPATADIRIQTNDQKLASYGRGTIFKIPDEMTFIRTASYWGSKCGDGYNIWYDNGFLFFDEKWTHKTSCVWNQERANKGAAIFSGDPTNSKDLKGRACQMIDLYIDKLQALGVRYALWGVLCYSNKPFSEANDVLATLQWGEHPEKGKLYEPARAQMVFPLKSDGMTSYLAYIDLETRELVYMDADLGGSTQSLKENKGRMKEIMPAYVEYLASLPTVFDLFSQAPTGDMPVVYSDANRAIKDGQKAFVFKPENPESQFEPLTLSDVLSA